MFNPQRIGRVLQIATVNLPVVQTDGALQFQPLQPGRPLAGRCRRRTTVRISLRQSNNPVRCQLPLPWLQLLQLQAHAVDFYTPEHRLLPEGAGGNIQLGFQLFNLQAFAAANG